MFVFVFVRCAFRTLGISVSVSIRIQPKFHNTYSVLFFHKLELTATREQHRCNDNPFIFVILCYWRAGSIKGKLLIFPPRSFAWFSMELSLLLLGIALHAGVTALARDPPPTSNIGVSPPHSFPALSLLPPLEPETRSNNLASSPPTTTSALPQLVNNAPIDAESGEMDFVPYGFCADQLETTKRELRLASLAQRCLRSKACILERDRLRLNAEWMAVNEESLGDLLHSSPNDIHARPKETHINSKDIHATFDIQFSMRDWKRLAKWNYARDTSLLWGYPTLRLQMIDRLAPMEDPLERRAPEEAEVKPVDGSEANQLDAEDRSQESDDLVSRSSHMTPRASTFGDGSESPTCADHGTGPLLSSKVEDWNAGPAIGGTVFRRTGRSALSFCLDGDLTAPSISQECPFSYSVRTKSIAGLLSKIQPPPAEAQMCLLKPRQSLFSKSGLPTSRALERDEYIVTFLDPLGSGKEAEVWRVCIHGKPNNIKTRSNRKAAAVNDPVPYQVKTAAHISDISSAEVSALKVYRRQFRLPRGRKPNSREHSIKSPIPPFPVVWKKALASFMEAVEFGSVIPMDVAVVPLRAWNLEGSAFRMTSHPNSEPANRYTVYLGYAASFEVAEGDLSEFGYRFYDGRIPSRMLASLTEGLVRALKVVEATGHVWMDFKPENFLIVDGKPKIGDVGFMRVLQLDC